MNKKLNGYVNEIIAIAGTNDVSWDVGVNMFLANVKNYGKEGACYYEGADLDWGAVVAELGPITLAAEVDMINTYCADYRKNMKKVIALRKAGDYEGAKEVMLD